MSVPPIDLGPEYPRALHMPCGERLRLLEERRWSRHFGTSQRVHIISRFMDGSASIALPALLSEWPHWSGTERRDFLLNCEWLSGQADFPDMLRFLVSHAAPSECSTLGQSIARALPSEEAFSVLHSLMSATLPGERSNYFQALALMRHPRSLEVIRRELAVLQAESRLWDDDEFLNWIAYAATCAVEYILLLGGEPEELEPLVRQLASHPCKGNVDAARRFLGKHYAEVFAGGAA